MDELVQWLRVQLDDDERTALTWPADQRSWEEYGDRRIDYASGAGEDVSAVNVKASAALGWERIYVKRDGIGLSGHIVRHDPARVLREIDTKRRLLDLHAPDAMGTFTTCTECGQGYEMHDWGPAYPCATVRLLALPYADRPGYRDEWRP